MMISRLLRTLPLIALTGSCASGASVSPENREWVLLELDGEALNYSNEEKAPQMRLDSSANRANGFSGCNRFFGGYELNGESLEFGPMASTRRACPTEEMDLEMKFLKMLASVDRWEASEDELTLFAGDRSVARFSPGGRDQ